MARRPIVSSALLVFFALASLPVAAANLVVVVTDAAGQGFNDPTPAVPVGGNMGTTLGAQRLNVFKEAARIWGGLLPSNVDIRISSSFQALTNPDRTRTCDANSAVLGSAGATTIFADFQNAPIPGTFYAKALADKLAGFEIDSSTKAINARFESELGKPGCLTGVFFYLGLDNNQGNNVNLLSVVLHEFGHGLGFQSFTDFTNSPGSFEGNLPGIFDRFLLDTTLGKTWDQLIATQRVTSSVNTGNLEWNGPNGAVYANAYMSKRPRLLVTAPAAAAGTYEVGSADFGPPLSSQNVSGQIVAGLSGSATDGCTAITSNVSGNIALVDRGTCNFTVKVKNAQNARAAGVIVVDNVAGSVAGMGGTDPTITIPSVRITLSDGTKLKTGLPATASLGLDATQFAGADASGRLLMYAPSPFESGSSVSHWDTTASPNLLMEPNISSDLGSTVDATLAAFQDIGWFLGSTTLPTTWVLPSSAHAPGANGAFFSTDLTVTNTGTADATFTLKFLGNKRDGRTGAEVVRTVAAGRTVTYADVLGSVFGVNAADAQNFGAILINADTNALRIVSQTSTPPPSGIGTFGQAVPAQTGDDFVTPAFPRALLGLRQDSAFRTNAVIANATDQPVHVDLALISESGASLGSTAIDLQPLEMRQIGGVVTALGAPGGTSDAVLVVSTPTGGARIATYAAMIDQTTNDPRTILGDVLGLFATGVSSTYLLPSSAHGGGQNGSFFTTDLTVSNQGTTDATITFKFLGNGQDGRSGPEVVRPLAAGKSTTYTDVLGSLFGVGSAGGFGAIRISADTKALKIVSQTSTPPPSGGGTFGQAVPALGPSDFVTSFAPRWLVGLRQDSAFRTNAVIANATDQAAHVDLTLKSEDGATLGTGGFDLQPYEMRQISTVVTALGAAPGTSNASLVVSTPTAGARIATYAAIIDQKTNDPRTVP